MRALWSTTIAAIWLAGASCIGAETEAEVSVSIVTSKMKYLRGEPILVKTTYENRGPSKKFRRGVGLGGDSFSLKLTRGGDKWFSLVDGRRIPFPVSIAPYFDDFWSDRYALPRSLEPRERMHRIDTLLVDTGAYRVKAELRDDKGRVYQSDETPFEVAALAGEECLTELVGREVIPKLGSAIHFMHYQGKTGGGRGFWRSLTGDQFGQLAPKIIAQCEGSVFRESVFYCYILSNRNRRLPCHPVTDPRIKKLAEQFLVDYPDSWFIPEVCRTLFWTYLKDRDVTKAVAVGRRGLAVEPFCTVLIGVKQKMDRIAR